MCFIDVMFAFIVLLLLKEDALDKTPLDGTDGKE